MWFGIYNLGTILLIGGVLYICHLAHIPQPWMVGVAILLLGAGIIGAMSNTRSKNSN